MMGCYKFNETGKVLTEEELLTKIQDMLLNPPEEYKTAFDKIASVVYKAKTPEGILEELQTKGKAAQIEQKNNPSKYISASKFVPAKHVIGTLELPRFTPEMDMAQRKKHYIEEHLHDPDFGGNTAAIEKAFDDQVATEQEYSKIGTHVHSIVNILLTKGATSKEYKDALQKIEDDLKAGNYALAKAVTSEDSTIQHTDIAKIQNAIVNEAKSIVQWINVKWPTNKRKAIFSEMPMLLENTSGVYLTIKDGDSIKDYDGLLGIADLIIVDDSGKVHLVDYKVSTRPYAQWYQAKHNEVQYQMGIYRAVMTAHGIDGDDISITIKPTVLPKGKISLMEGTNEIDMLASTNPSSNPNLAWRGGKFTANLRRLGIGEQPIVKLKGGSELSSQIDEDYDKVIGFHKDPKRITKQDIIDNGKIEVDRDARGNAVGYKFWSNLEGTKGGYIKKKTLEEFTKDGGVIDQYLTDLEEAQKHVVQTIVSEIEKVKSGKIKPNQLFENERNTKRAALLRQKLGKYTDANWECVADKFPQLADYGLIVFKKTDRATGEVILDIVSIAEFPLHETVLINGEQTLLGKYYTYEEAEKLDIDVMESTYRNVKALQAISILNSVLIQNPTAFENKSLGNLVILNPFGPSDDNKGIDLDQLRDNFSLLCTKAGIENKIQGVRFPTTYEYCMSELQTVLSSLGEDKDLKQLLSDIDNGTDTLYAKRKRVKELLKRMREKYKVLRTAELGSHNFNLNDPVQLCYLILAQMNNYLHGVKIDFRGKIETHGINLSNLFSLLGLTFTGKMAIKGQDGSVLSGFGGGMEMTSPRSTPSSTLRQLNAYYDVVYNNVRKQFDDQSNYVSRLTREYINNFTSDSKLFFSSQNINVWERLLVKNGDQIDTRMLIKNPYDRSNDLTEIDREFLKEWLWEVNKYLIPGADQSWHYKDHKDEIEQLDAVSSAMSNNDSEYFFLPLARSESFQRLTHLKDYGLGEYFKAKWKDFEESYDPRALHNERRAQIKANDIVEMYNNYIISPAERGRLIDSAHGVYDFQLDMDFLAMDVAFQSIRKEHFDNALMLTETVLTMMEFQQQESGANFKPEIDTARTQAKLSLTGESVLSEAEEDIAKPLSAIKQLNSFVVLAFRPLAFVKEIAFGLFTNYSRAWALKFSSNKLGLASVTKASSIVWGQHFGKYGNAFTGSGSLSDFTLCESINKLYGIANSDLNYTSKNASLSRLGKFNNMSKWMYIAQSAPDYFNRLTLFIAKMIEDGCFEAHSLDENGKLVYDWKKDRRFDKLAEHGLNSDYNDPEYNQQKALYAAMCQEFEKGDEELITWDKEKKKYVYGDITQAYTPDQRASIKEVADTAYGYYDHESKSQLNQKFLGLVFLQFQTFLTAKYNLWFKGGRKGKNTAQGKFVHMERNGEKYYDRFVTDDQGNLIRVEKVPESQLTESEKSTLQPSMEWKGDFVEGLFLSIGHTIHDIVCLNWKEVASNKQRLLNVALAMHDILIGIILVSILKAIFSDGSNKLQAIQPAKRVLVRAMEDVGPGAFTKLSITPSFINTLNTLKSDGIKLLFHDSQEAIDTMTKHFGMTRDFIWED